MNEKFYGSSSWLKKIINIQEKYKCYAVNNAEDTGKWSKLADQLQDNGMKIGIEAQRLFRPGKHGMEVVALELIRRLPRLDKKNEYLLFVKKDTDMSGISELPNLSIRYISSLTLYIFSYVCRLGAGGSSPCPEKEQARSCSLHGQYGAADLPGAADPHPS